MVKTITHDSAALDIRIVLVDDHELFLAGLVCLIQTEPGLTVVGQALNRAQAFDAVRTRPDIIVLDLLLGTDNSLEFLSDLINAAQGARVLVLTGVPDRDLHLRAIRLGAMGVMLKLEWSSSFFKAIRKVYNGEVWLNRSMMGAAIAEAFRVGSGMKTDSEQAKIASLTSRERQIIGLLGEGLKNKGIGERLFISEKTVGHHLSSIFAKVEVTDRLELLIYAYQHNLAKVPPRLVPDLPEQPKSAAELLMQSRAKPLPGASRV